MIKKLEKEIVEKLVSDNAEERFVCMPINPELAARKKSSSWGQGAHDIIITAKKWKVRCSCEESNGEEQENDIPECKHCGRSFEHMWRGNQVTKKLLVPSKTKTEIEKLYNDNNTRSRNSYGSGNFYVEYKDKSHSVSIYTRDMVFRTYYVREKLDCKAGIDMVRLTVSYGADGKHIKVEEKYDCFTEIVPGKKITAYKYTKARGEEEISLFDAFHITTGNVTEDENIHFEGATSMIDFMSANIDFANRTGFMHLLMNYQGNIPENSLFLLYMYLLSEYPVIELLVKMGYYGLIFDLFTKICCVYRRDSIKEQVDNLSCLLNQTTKGSAALSIPTYVGQFLNSKNANINEYLAWAAVNEREPISKDNFEKYVSSEAYLYLNYYDCLKNLPNIMKYGYTLAQTSKYILNQLFSLRKDKMTINNTTRYDSLISGITTMWSDYLQHCELMDIEPAKFPKNLRSVHDDAVEAYRAIQNIETDCKISCIADLYSGYKTTSKYLDVVWPRCVSDFVNEGNNQHNCVAGYSSRVSGGYCRIFFIRKQDALDKSYITAECTKHGLGQLYYRNNQPVQDYTEIEYAKAICKYILNHPWEPDANDVAAELKRRRGGR